MEDRAHRQRHEDTFTSLSGGRKKGGVVLHRFFIYFFFLRLFLFTFRSLPQENCHMWHSIHPYLLLLFCLLITNFEEIAFVLKRPREEEKDNNTQKNKPSKR
jgi:hypothetical protein